MSEFTSGYLFLKQNEEKIRQSPPPEMIIEDRWRQLNEQLRPGLTKENQPPFIIKNLNEKWSVLLIEEVSANRESKKQLRAWVLEVSKQCPLLYFENAEDHGWGYKLFEGGSEVASADVNYEEGYDDESDEDGDANSQEELDTQYENKNINAFARFDISPDIIDTLDKILTSTWYLNAEDIWSQVAEFKEKLGITEMEWTSYDYEITDRYHGQAT